MKARCKFTVVSITDSGGTPRSIKLLTSYDPSIEEDQKFSKYTPSGTIDVNIDNPSVLPMFKVGAQFYVDLVPIEPATAASNG